MLVLMYAILAPGFIRAAGEAGDPVIAVAAVVVPLWIGLGLAFAPFLAGIDYRDVFVPRGLELSRSKRRAAESATREHADLGWCLILLLGWPVLVPIRLWVPESRVATSVAESLDYVIAGWQYGIAGWRDLDM